MRKKLLAMLTAGGLCAMALPLENMELPTMSLTALAAECTVPIGTSTTTLTYEVLENGTLEIMGCDNYMSTGKLEIPSEINGKPVTKIGEEAFRETAITEVVIPEGVISVEDNAFSSCKGLTKVTLPDSLTRLGNNAFAWCTVLTEVEIPDKLIDIGATPFYDTAWLTAKQEENPLVIVNGILIDGETCSGSVTIPDSVIRVGADAFCWSTLTEVVIPDSVIDIENRAFEDCSSLVKVEIPDNGVNIGDDAFRECGALSNIVLPDSVKNIGTGAFIGTAWLEEKQRENPLVIVNKAVIDGSTCSGDVVIPNGVTRIGNGAFRYGTLTGITIPNSVTSIGERAFYESSLVKITIPNSVTDIGGSAFMSCTSLERITLPEGITSLPATYLYQEDSGFFSGCTALKEVQLPSTLKNINYLAFCYCPSLESITIPENVEQIENSAFADCTNLKNVYYTGKRKQWNAIKIDNEGNDDLLDATIHFADGNQTKADLDGDEKVDTNDVFEAMLYVAYRGAGMSSNLTADQIAAADIDGDGSVDSTDVYYILYYVALQGAGKNPTWSSVLSR